MSERNMDLREYYQSRANAYTTLFVKAILCGVLRSIERRWGPGQTEPERTDNDLSWVGWRE
jgi:hypothetical protein